MMGEDCRTCAYRDDCTTTCMGYLPDDDTQTERDNWDELAADVKRDDSVGEE